MEKKDLSAKLLDRWFGDIDKSRLDLWCGMVEFINDALAFLGKRQVDLDSLELKDYSRGFAKAVKSTDKGDVLVQVYDWPCKENGPEWMPIGVLSLGDMFRICMYVNFLVQAKARKPEKPKKRKTVKKRTCLDPVTFESRMKGEQ